MSSPVSIERIRTAVTSGDHVEARRLRHELYVQTLERVAASGDGLETALARQALEAERMMIQEEIE